jgi:hypothetical protein
MPIEPEKQQKFWDWLKNQGVIPECPFCHARHNQQYKNLVIGEFIEAVDSNGNKVRMLQLICERCTFVSLFSIAAWE